MTHGFIRAISSVQFSHSVVSNFFWPHGLQYAGLPCPSPTPRAYSDSCPPSQGCLPTISSSVIPFCSLQSFPASGSFPMSQFFASDGQSIGVSTSASVLPMNIQGWFPLGLTSLSSLKSKELLRVFSSTTMWSSIFWYSDFFMIQLSHPYMTTRKIVTLTIWIYRILEGFAILSSSDFVLSELSTMIHLSWVALHGMDHSFIELHKPLYHYKAVIYEGTLLVTYSIHNSV